MCTWTSRSGRPCPTCTLKGAWWTMVSTQSHSTCEQHTSACLAAWLPATDDDDPPSPLLPLPGSIKRMTCGWSSLFRMLLISCPATANPRWTLSWWHCSHMSWLGYPRASWSFTAACSSPTGSWPTRPLAPWSFWMGGSNKNIQVFVQFISWHQSV